MHNKQNNNNHCIETCSKINCRDLQKPYATDTLRRNDLFTIPRRRRRHHTLQSTGAISVHLSQLREENKRSSILCPRSMLRTPEKRYCAASYTQETDNAFTSTPVM